MKNVLSTIIIAMISLPVFVLCNKNDSDDELTTGAGQELFVKENTLSEPGKTRSGKPGINSSPKNNHFVLIIEDGDTVTAEHFNTIVLKKERSGEFPVVTITAK